MDLPILEVPEARLPPLSTRVDRLCPLVHDGCHTRTALTALRPPRSRVQESHFIWEGKREPVSRVYPAGEPNTPDRTASSSVNSVTHTSMQTDEQRKRAFLKPQGTPLHFGKREEAGRKGPICICLKTADQSSGLVTNGAVFKSYWAEPHAVPSLRAEKRARLQGFLWGRRGEGAVAEDAAVVVRDPPPPCGEGWRSQKAVWGDGAVPRPRVREHFQGRN